jgi:hypothetical protein
MSDWVLIVWVHEPRKTGDGEEGPSKLGSGFSALLGFHKVYSELLLISAKKGLENRS